MTSPWFFRLAVIGALAISFTLSACGRKGGLELPPRATAQPVAEPQQAQSDQQQPSQWTMFGSPTSGEDEHGNPPPPKGQKKSFLLDWLLN